MKQIQMLDLTELHFSAKNARQRDIDADVDQLAASMARIGLQQPIVVQRRPAGGFEVLIGQRRLLAAQRLKWDVIPSIVVDEPIDEVEAKALSFSENVQRRDLSPSDKADACAYLLHELGTVKAVADFVGTSDTTIRKWLGLANAPEEVKTLVREKRLSPTIAARITQASATPQKAIDLAQSIVEQSSSPDMVQRIVHAAQDFPREPVDVIVERARERRERRHIIFSLPEEYERALDLACKDLRREAADIAEEATMSWLDAHLYGQG